MIDQSCEDRCKWVGVGYMLEVIVRWIVGFLIGWWVGLVTMHHMKVSKLRGRVVMVLRMVVVKEEEER